MKIILNFLLIVFSLFFLSGCNDQVLVNNMTQRQCNEIISRLSDNGIAAKKKDMGKAGHSVSVSSDEFTAAIAILEIYNLPSKDPIEIQQAFPDDSLIASPQAERARLLSMIEQRLEQSILIIPGVVSSKIHVSYSQQKTKWSSDQVQRVSSIIIYSGDEQISDLQNKIKLFLKNSFTDMDYDNVSVLILERPSIQRTVVPISSNSSNTILITILYVSLFIVFSIIIFILFKRNILNKSVEIKSLYNNKNGTKE